MKVVELLRGKTSDFSSLNRSSDRLSIKQNARGILTFSEQISPRSTCPFIFLMVDLMKQNKNRRIDFLILQQDIRTFKNGRRGGGGGFNPLSRVPCFVDQK